MKKVDFYVDYCFEAGIDDYGCNLSGRYEFWLNLSDEEYQELHQVCSDQEQVNSWSTDWSSHDELYKKIDVTAYNVLTDLLKQYSPEFAPPINVLWELIPDATI